MFRIISLLIWTLVITISLLWFINNSGIINIVWLGYEVEISILTSLLFFIILSGIIFLIYKIISITISLILGFFGIFKVSELKKRDKMIKKYEEAVELMAKYLSTDNKKDTKSFQKKINSLLKNKELKEAFIKNESLKKD